MRAGRQADTMGQVNRAPHRILEVTVVDPSEQEHAAEHFGDAHPRDDPSGERSDQDRSGDEPFLHGHCDADGALGLASHDPAIGWGGHLPVDPDEWSRGDDEPSPQFDGDPDDQNGPADWAPWDGLDDQAAVADADWWAADHDGQWGFEAPTGPFPDDGPLPAPADGLPWSDPAALHLGSFGPGSPAGVELDAGVPAAPVLVELDSGAWPTEAEQAALRWSISG
jgi:hypothetical protein